MWKHHGKCQSSACSQWRPSKSSVFCILRVIEGDLVLTQPTPTQSMITDTELKLMKVIASMPLIMSCCPWNTPVQFPDIVGCPLPRRKWLGALALAKTNHIYRPDVTIMRDAIRKLSASLTVISPSFLAACHEFNVTLTKLIPGARPGARPRSFPYLPGMRISRNGCDQFTRNKRITYQYWTYWSRR